MRHATHRASRRGLTLIEMMIAMVLTLVVFSAAVPFFRTQARSVTRNAGRMDALQNAHFALNAVDRELRVAGLGVVDKQPMLVQADPYAVTFNADLVTADRTDPTAVYFDAVADPALATSLPNTRRITLPRSSVVYPDSSFFVETTLPSHAETVSYWVSRDSTSARSDVYILFRRVNDAQPRVVARGILIAPGQPFFRYFRPDSLGLPSEIPTSQLPLYHTAGVHGSAADTGRFAWVDSVRSVRVRVTALFTSPRRDSVSRTVESNIRLLNAGMIHRATCGTPPLPVTLAVTVGRMNSSNSFTPGTGGTGTPTVRLTWNASVDQSGGERDVERYALYRRRAGTAVWGEPFLGIPASTASFTYYDTGVQSGQIWEYAIVAQDCSAQNSALSATAPVTIP